MRPLVKAVLVLAVAAGGVSVALIADKPGHNGTDVLSMAGQRGFSPSRTPIDPDGRLVLVSGRDDHGLLATAHVTLRERPGGTPVAQVADGSLARVVSTRGTWLEVRTVEGPPAQGWVDDFYLRGVVHLVGPAPTCRVQMGGQVLPAGEQAVVLDVRNGKAKVRVARTGQTGWVERSEVRELAPEHDCGQAASPEHSDSNDHS